MFPRIQGFSAAASFCLAACFCNIAQAQRATVELTVIMARPDLNTQQTWGELLADVGADHYSLKGGQRTRVMPEVKTSEGRGGPAYEIIGVLNGNQLLLPGGKFGVRDKQKIRDLIESIRVDGPNTALSEKMAFGMTAEQLVTLQQDLATAHQTSTAGKQPLEVIKAIATAIQTPIEIDPSAKKSLAEDSAVAEELLSLSSGTTLAAVLRPLGLVAVPRREQGRQAEIVIIDSREADEHWPIGWPLEGAPLAAVPKMFDQQDADIINYKLKTVLDIIEKTCEVPFLYDHNAIARHSVDLDYKVSFKQDRVSYFAVVSRLLYQVRPQLKSEVRLDEAGKPFLWITTQRK